MQPAECKNQTALAKLFDISRTTVTKWVKRADFPCARRGPWSKEQVAEIHAWWLNWRRTTPEEAAEVALDKYQVELKLKTEKMLTERIKREILEGKYLPRDQVDGALGGIAAVFIEALDAIEESIPTRVAQAIVEHLQLPPAKVSELAGIIDPFVQSHLDRARQRLIEHGSYELVKITELVQESGTRRRGRPTA